MNAGKCRVVVVLILSVIIAVPVGTLVHELGHGITAVALGGRIEGIWVWPVRLFPGIQFTGWQLDQFGWCSTSGVESEWGRGLKMLMGSGATSVLAYLLLIVSSLRLRASWLSIGVIAVGTVFAWDIFLYSTLPLAGLQHGVVIGGKSAEPLWGAVGMGVPRWTYFVFLMVHFVTFHALLCWTRVRPGLWSRADRST